mgnify:CR=1 FL=1
MNKYVYSECSSDEFPDLKTITAKSYNDAVDKLIRHYINKFDDDNNITNIDCFDDLQDYLNETYTLVISDLVDVEDL